MNSPGSGLISTDRYGYQVRGLGDLDGDGHDDFGIQAWANPINSVVGTGRIEMRSGQTGALIHTVFGDSAGDAFGVALDSVGDINGDGIPDFAAGAPYPDYNGMNSGRVRVYSGADAAVLLTVDGPTPHGEFGYSLAGGVDANGDGIPDIVVGAPQGSTTLPSGAVYVISGSDGSTLLVRVGESLGDRLGISVDAGGDVDGDGIADFIVGAPVGGIDGPPTGRSGLCRVYATITPPYSTYDSLAGQTDLQLDWLPQLGDPIALTGSISCTGASPAASGLFCVSLAPIDVLVPPTGPQVPLLVAIDPVNLLAYGLLGFGNFGDFLINSQSRQNAFLAGTSLHIQFFETFPVIRSSNGLIIELTN